MRSIFISLLRKNLRIINITFPKRIGNQTFYIPLLGGAGLSNLKSHEVWMDDLLEKLLLSENDVCSFFDIGANIGQTLLKVRAISKKVHYIGFEPNPGCVHYLNHLVANNSHYHEKMKTKVVCVSYHNPPKTGAHFRFDRLVTHLAKKMMLHVGNSTVHRTRQRCVEEGKG
jgi:hypothetical protein